MQDRTDGVSFPTISAGGTQFPNSLLFLLASLKITVQLLAHMRLRSDTEHVSGKQPFCHFR